MPPLLFNMKNLNQLFKLANECTEETARLELVIKDLLNSYLEGKINTEDLEKEIEAIETKLIKVQAKLDYIDAMLGGKLKSSDFLDLNEN